MEKQSVDLKSPFYNWLYRKIENHSTYLHKMIKSDVVEEFHDNYCLMDYRNNDDLIQWCEIINNSYSDAMYSLEKASRFLNNHPSVKNNRTVFYVLYGKKIATISFGEVRSRENAGSLFRIAVLPEYQGEV